MFLNMCHPNYRFPNERDIHHSKNHWNNAATMKRDVEKIIDCRRLNRCVMTRDLPIKQEALFISMFTKLTKTTSY